MSKHVRFGSFVSTAVLASMSVGCAAPQEHAVAATSRVDGDVGLAIRAAAALSSNDFASAVTLAERAAQKTPGDAGVRALLGNAYFASGRFASAEAAFKDSLFIESNQPGVILKLALVQIAQGKNDQALTFLEAGRGVLDAADYGLALALAGRPEAGVAELQPAARALGADARVRENLALAYALAGDWANARTVAAQDVPADQLDARIHQWMQLARPNRASDQIAALVGVTPAAADPGQPVQLALRKDDNSRLAAAVPVRPTAPVRVAQALQPLPAAPFEAPRPVVVAQTAPQLQVPAAIPQPHPAAPRQQVEQPAISMAQAAIASPEAPALFAAMVRKSAVHPPVRKAAVHIAAAAPRFVGLRNGRSQAVVQIGAYSKPQAVAAAWDRAERRFGNLRGYTPMSARFDSQRGTVYRLAVRGFATFTEANALCGNLRRQGTSCFVRTLAGDAPVQIAMR